MFYAYLAWRFNDKHANKCSSKRLHTYLPIFIVHVKNLVHKHTGPHFAFRGFQKLNLVSLYNLFRMRCHSLFTFPLPSIPFDCSLSRIPTLFSLPFCLYLFSFLAPPFTTTTISTLSSLNSCFCIHASLALLNVSNGL